MKLKFHGVRGSIAVSGKEHARYGGATTCKSVRTRSNDLLIFDAGTGIHPLGHEIMRQDAANALAMEALAEFTVAGLHDLAILQKNVVSTEDVKPFKKEIHLFFTHYHIDHLIGFPMFLPIYMPDWTIHVYGPLKADHRLRDALAGLMRPTYFPVSLDQLKSTIVYHEILEDTVRINDTSVMSRPLNHPQGSLGFRVTSGECSIAIATDVEHGEDGPDENLIAIAEGADALIYDGQYTPEEYEMKRRWGHSTWHEGIRLARAAGAKSLYICHHDPAHNDDFLDEMQTRMRESFPESCMAAENTVIALSPDAPTPTGRDADADSDPGPAPAIEIRGAGAVIRCGPSFRSLLLPAFQERLRELIAYGVREAIFRCPDISRWGGEGLVALADTARAFDNRGVAVRFEQVSPALRQRLEAARFNFVAAFDED